MHAMNLTHPSFVSFVESVADNVGEFITSGALSPGYLFTSKNRGLQGFITISNIFSVFEKSIGEIFTLMEEDLEGKFTSHTNIEEYPPLPYIRENSFHFRSKTYERYAIVPLVMDFSRLQEQEESKPYYVEERQEKILSYVEQTLQGVASHRKRKKSSIFEFFPFLGINPEVHPLPFIEKLLSTYVRKDENLQWKKSSNKQFRGIKFYPPLGTNPWPEEREKLEKIRFIYEFCEHNNLGIITHCDDQGFRGVTAKIAQSYTDPASWRVVFEHYPRLKVDFAHWGRQYNRIKKSPLKVLLDRPFTDDPWASEIIDLMQEYENVYADFSFSGTQKEFYEELHSYIDSTEDKEVAKRVVERSLFGSDFQVNLAKVESYTHYLRIFENSPFSDQEVHQFASINPLTFLSID